MLVGWKLLTKPMEQNLIANQEIPHVYGTRRFITIITKPYH